MTETEAKPADALGAVPLGGVRPESLRRELFRLALPVLAEHTLHIFVGLNDTYLANHLPNNKAAAATAVGNVGYIIWFLGIFASAIGTGSIAIIAREIGARHRRRANSACGQSMLFAGILGLSLGFMLFVGAGFIAKMMGLEGAAHDQALAYLRMLCPSIPFLTVMFVANSCLRGAGDTLTPAIAMIVVDVVNAFFSWGLTWGWFGMPTLGFDGIAIGTVIAYIVGGVLQIAVLLIGRGGIRLHLHRLRPHLHDMQRIIRIGLPSGATEVTNWIANFAVLRVVNRTAPIPIAAAAHVNTIRIEALSYMIGFAVSLAVATMVGQSLGMKDPRRAARSAYLGYLFGGGFMAFVGLLFILFGHYPAQWMVDDPAVRALTTRCLFITGFCQSGFAAAIIFGGALRGAGDTMAVMVLTTISILAMRFGGVMFVGAYLHKPLPIIWIVLAGDLFVRGVLIYGRFIDGSWKRIKV